MSSNVVHLHKNTDPPAEPAPVTTLTVIPDAPAAPSVPLWVRSGRAIRAAVTDERTKTAARTVARQSLYVFGGARIVGRRAWDGRTAARYERYMRTAEATGNMEAAAEWEERGQRFREARHRRRMDLLHSPLDAAKGAAVSAGMGVGGLVLLGIAMVVATKDPTDVVTPLMAVIKFINLMITIVRVVWGPLVTLGPFLAFDTENGLPVSEVRERNRTNWYAHARAHAAREWPTAAAKHRASIAESLTIATMALCPTGKGRPADDLLRRALYPWGFNAGRHDQQPPEAEARALAWVERNAPAVTDLDSPQRVRTVLEHLAKRQDGKPAAANTFRRRRAVLSNCLRLAVEHELLPGNPLHRVHWETPKAVEELDVRSVATPAQARALLDAVRAQGLRGAHLVAFFACIYYAAMRPEEVSMLSADQCELPSDGWGRLMLAGARPQVGSAWTDDGKPYEERQLKHRARRAVRPVPIPPVLVGILRDHLDTFGTTAEGRLFSAVRGGPVRSQEYGAVWKEVRRKALTPAQVASPLAAIPYDLRHACVSFWLRSGVSLAETARRAGQSVAVLQRYYAKVLDGEEDRMNALIDQGLAEDESGAEGP